MTDEPPSPGVSNQGNIDISGSVQNQSGMLILGNGNHIEINGIGQESLRLLVLSALKEVLQQASDLSAAGIRPEIAQGATPSAPIPAQENAARPVIDPSGSVYGLRLSDLSSRSPKELERLTQRASSVDQLFQQLGQQLGESPGNLAALQLDGKRVEVTDLLLQQGNLALWRFRRAMACLFAQVITADMRARMDWPQPPPFQILSQQARGNREVLRGLALLNMVTAQRPELALPASEQLSQGRWREVLDGWASSRQLPDENIQLVRTQIESIGEIYRPAEVREFYQKAFERFSEVLHRQPQNTTAMINLALLMAEHARFTYVESGVADRAKMRKAMGIFQQARDLLSRRSDRESKIALGRCLLYSGSYLSSEVHLGSVQWARTQMQFMRAMYSRQVQAGIQWDMVQRNLATNEPSFYSPVPIQQARDLFAEIGETVQAEQCTRILQGLEQTRTTIPLFTQQMQSLAPLIGTWRCQTRNLFGVWNGLVVFTVDGRFFWQGESQGLMVGGAQRMVVLGQCQVIGMMTAWQGQRWTMQIWPGGQAGPPLLAPFFDQLIILSNDGNHLVLRSQQDGSQIQGQRL
ncbi:MAG TPA: hypothetical protein VGD98_07335 [Ktedonobacteraceae bacterium]